MLWELCIEPIFSKACEIQHHFCKIEHALIDISH
jgi:hypothetical protein